MEGMDISRLKTQSLVIKILKNIPSHKDTPKHPSDILTNADFGTNSEIRTSITYSVTTFLNLFGVLEWNGELCRYKGDIPEGFKDSIIWFFYNNIEIFSNWRRKGASRDISVSNLLDMAPYFLRIIEERRLELSQQNNLDIGASRELLVSTLIIKKNQNKKPCLLFQWDQFSEGYQLIGGKIRGSESPMIAAQREMQEEISQHDLVYERDYFLRPLTEAPIEAIDISRTNGSLTKYKFWVFFVEFNLPDVRLSNIDRWISFEEFFQGHTSSGHDA
jgi:hypothetical protein